MADLSIESLYSVKGQVVVITGGGSGLGKILAQAFAVNGAKVYITGRREDMLVQSAEEGNKVAAGKGSIIPIVGDVSTKASAKAIYAKLAETETRVDTLVNCAGVLRGFRKNGDHDNLDELEEILNSVEDEDFTLTNNVNISGPYFTTISLLPLLRASPIPNVINICSIAAFSLGRKVGSLTYGVSKAGAVFVGQQLASRLGPYKIRVNSISPGIFPSEMTGSNIEVIPKVSRESLEATAVIKRMGQPQEIAGPVLMLASPAGGYMTNANLVSRLFAVEKERKLTKGLRGKVVDGGRLIGMSSAF